MLSTTSPHSSPTPRLKGHSLAGSSPGEEIRTTFKFCNPNKMSTTNISPPFLSRRGGLNNNCFGVNQSCFQAGVVKF